MPRRGTTVAGIVIAFTLLNAAILFLFYGVIPYSNPSTLETTTTFHPTAAARSEAIITSSSKNDGQSFASTLRSARRLPARKMPQCFKSDAAMTLSNLEGITKPGPYPNLEQRRRLEASLHLLDIVDSALTEGGICFWLDASSLLGALHHATPFPYANGIEIAILLSDVQRTVSALRFHSKDYLNGSIFLDEGEGVSRLRIAVPSNSLAAPPSIQGALMYINLYATAKDTLTIHKPPYTIDLENIFPLQRALLSGRTVWVPKDSEHYLRALLNEEFDQHPRVIDWGTMSYIAPTTVRHSEYYPLISIVIVTHERHEFLTKSIELIRRQDYPNIEIVIVDDSAKPLAETSAASILQEKGLTYFHLTGERQSIGDKRNMGVQAAKGVIIAHWDDDDYFREHRITEQVAPILSGDVDMSVLEHHYYFHLPSKTFYIVKRTSAWGPHFGTFVFKRSLFENGIRYPGTSLAEDYAFAEFALKRGATIRVLDNSDGKHVYTRHFNTWEFEFNEYIANVRRVEKPDFFSDEDFRFFTSVTITPPKSKPPKHYAAPEIAWNRPELRPGWQDAKSKLRPKTLTLPEDWTLLEYPHYSKHASDHGLSTGEQIGIGVGTTGGAILVGGALLFGILYFIRFRRRQSEQGYIALSQEFNL